MLKNRAMLPLLVSVLQGKSVQLDVLHRLRVEKRLVSTPRASGGSLINLNIILKFVYLRLFRKNIFRNIVFKKKVTGYY